MFTAAVISEPASAHLTYPPKPEIHNNVLTQSVKQHICYSC